MQIAPRFLPPLTMREERAQLVKLHDERQRLAHKVDPAWVVAFYKGLTQLGSMGYVLPAQRLP